MDSQAVAGVDALVAMGFPRDLAETAWAVTSPEAGEADRLEQAVGFLVSSPLSPPDPLSGASEVPTVRHADGPHKLMLVVRQDLQMGVGKVAAQCTHAALGVYQMVVAQLLSHEHQRWLAAWQRDGEATIVVSCTTEEELLALMGKAEATRLPAYVVQDAGRTQVAPGSRTVLAIGPGPAALLDPITGGLKLL